MRILAITFFLAIGIFSQMNAQSSFLPKNLGSPVNSPYDEINPVISNDGKTLFFIRVNHPENTFGANDSQDIWYSQLKSDSTWSPAKRLENLNNARYNSVLGVSGDGKTLLLNGVFNNKGTFWKQRGVSMSTGSGVSWGVPEQLTIKKIKRKNRGLKSSGSLSADGKTVLLSFGKVFNGKKTDLYLIQRKESGRWKRPKKLKDLNSSKSEDAPYLSSDGKTIYFSSDRATKNQFDIYKATRVGDDWKNWSEPKRVSDTVNSPAWESYFKTNKKGSWAYFSSDNKLGHSDIFKVKMFEENPYVIVSGKVLNARNEKTLTGKKFTIAANGGKIDSIQINSDLATYRAKLPLNKIYSLSASAENYISQPKELDVKGVKEFTTRNIDLYLKPISYVLVKGKLLIQDTGLPLPAAANAKILVNSVSNDSIKIDRQASTYEMRINHGASYEMRVKADRFEELPLTLDLTKMDEYQELNFDLFVADVKMAVVSGKILDKKTGANLKAISTAKINVEGQSDVFAKIDTVNATYELKLKPGSQYTISASAPNYYPLYEVVDASGTTGNIKISKDLIIVPIEVGQSIRLNNIFFDAGKSILKKESFSELDRVADFLTKNPEIKVEISGHTDNVGGAATNQKLSQSRAQSVADYVVKKGIPKDKVVAKGYGLAKPVASNATKEGKAQNRRVEFTILDK
jgi:outer membrane protein OmpA-like peptidoglycan-associated protein/Tol biopolymer transport system component